MTRIAIIEDDEDFSILLKRALSQDSDFEIAKVIDCEDDAMTWINSGSSQQINCILLDLNLPFKKMDRTPTPPPASGF